MGDSKKWPTTSGELRQRPSGALSNSWSRFGSFQQWPNELWQRYDSFRRFKEKLKLRKWFMVILWKLNKLFFV